MALAPAAGRLLELLEREPALTGGEALRRAAASPGLPDPEAAAGGPAPSRPLPLPPRSHTRGRMA